MKKIFFILTILLVAGGVSACNNNQQVIVKIEQSSSQETAVSAAPTNAAINETNQSASDQTADAPASQPEKVAENAIVTPVTPVVNNKTMLSPQEQPNLSAQYSRAVIKTNYGDITVKFYGVDSPMTVNNFLYLSQQGFYNGVKFHRVIKDFMIQGGDPLSKEADASIWGTGGPGYKFPDEFNKRPLVAGSLAMANAGPGTNGSQFFIVTAPATPWLDGHHTNFGEVVTGLDVVKKIEAAETGVNDRPVKDVVISSVELLK
ncbi:MAG: peptidylprolyl isomerase [Patescibacteria group bacterium]